MTKEAAVLSVIRSYSCITNENISYLKVLAHVQLLFSVDSRLQRLLFSADMELLKFGMQLLFKLTLKLLWTFKRSSNELLQFEWITACYFGVDGCSCCPPAKNSVASCLVWFEVQLDCSVQLARSADSAAATTRLVLSRHWNVEEVRALGVTRCEELLHLEFMLVFEVV